jgi:penicillin-binding protein 1B
LRRAAAGLGGLGALGIALAGLMLLVPLPLPESAIPSLIYSRPHQIAVGQNAEATGLVARLRRLGYQERRRGELAPGQYRRDGGGLRIAPREIRDLPLPAPPASVEVLIDRYGEISALYDEHGEPLGSVWLEPEVIGALYDREHVEQYAVQLDELPSHLVDAVLVVEDRRFYEHAGVDVRRLVGAALANLRAGRLAQGGSTLTQQLVKNVFLDSRRTLGRKLREAWLALRLERTHSKREILEAYLNAIYLGQNGSRSVRGVEGAARHYFGKRATELSVAQSALIAGMIRGPGYYSPFRHSDAALNRRNQVLAMLRETGHLSEEAQRRAVAEPLGALARPPETVSAPYFAAALRRELEGDLAGDHAGLGPLRVHTGLDPQLQLYAERALRRGLERLEKDFPRLRRPSDPLQAALVALDPSSGAVLAHVGGRGWSQTQFDRVTQAQRQPGSLFKAIVALAALGRGAEQEPPAFTLASLLRDEPLEVPTPEGTWRPENQDHQFRGWLTLRSAIEESVNVPMARVGLMLGPQRVIQTARRMGIRADLQAVPSLALGAFEMSPLEVARAYAVLASGGQRVDPLSYLSVRDSQGRLLAENRPRIEPAFDPAEVALVTSALQGVVDRGTGRWLREHGFDGPLAGKTGTTNDSRDAWFAGYTPDLVVVVWVGFDDGRSLGVTGSRAALPIFGEFAQQALGAHGGRPFATPIGVEYARVHAESGLLAGWGCGGEEEIFLEGTAPTESCGSGWLFGDRRDAAPWPPDAEPLPDPVERVVGAISDFFRVLANGRR